MRRMKTPVEEVVQRALALGEQDRAEVAARLLDSLEQVTEPEQASWIAEIERRAAEMESGAVKGISWEDLQERLLRRRAS